MFKRERGESGAVSVFLIMIFAAIFAFVAVFIDFSRMNAVRAQSETSLHAAVRSVLSSYDPELAQQYGLFAFGDTDGSYIMSKVLQDSYSLSSQKDGLNLLGARPELDSSELDFSKPLGLYSVFNQQIREQMKYKAPINIALDILGKLKPAAGLMKETSNTMDELGKLQKLHKQRENLISQVFDLQKEASDQASLLAESIQTNASGPDNAALGAAINSISDSAAQYPDFVSKLEEDAARDFLHKQYTAELGSFRNGSSKVFRNTGNLYQAAANLLNQLAARCLPLLDQAEQLNEEMKLVIQQSESRPQGEAYDSVSNGPTAGSMIPANLEGGQDIKKIHAESKSLLREDSFFADMREKVRSQSGDFESSSARVASLLSIRDSVINGVINDFQYNDAVMEAGQSTGTYAARYRSILDSEQQVIMRQHANEAEIKQAEDAAEGKLTEAKGLLGRLSELKEGYQEQQLTYNLLKQYNQENLRFNSATDNEEPVNEQQKPVYDAGADSIKEMDKLFGSLSQFLQQATDDCFQTEYAAEYFNAFDVTKLQGMLEQGSAGVSGGADFSPQQQEMEYILYGFHDPAGNLAAAFGEIFAMRLAIRTMEGFIANANKGNPLLILATALLYGVEHAVQDLLTLVKTGSIPISKYLDVPLSYKDHLRIFMLLHGASDGRLSRMLALIQLNTAADPDQKPTYVSGTVKTGIHLLFLPGVAKAINKVFSRAGEVEGSSYFTVKHAEDSY